MNDEPEEQDGERVAMEAQAQTDAKATRLAQQRAALAKAREARKAKPRAAAARTAKDARIGVMAHPEPATRRTEPTRESYRAEAPEQFTRRSRAERGTGNFDLPVHRKKRGWDYQWITITVLNQPVDGSRIRDFREGGWRPCLSRDWPELVDIATSDDAPIEMEGQRLMQRPMNLTIEARQEDEMIARQAQREKSMQAANGQSALRGSEYDIPGHKGVTRVPVSVEIEELAG